MTIAAVIPTWNRPEQLRGALLAIKACNPPPDEIIVHVDYGDTTTFTVLQDFPGIRVISSSVSVGPGGGRNALLAAASCPLVASFDDDSWPLDPNFFGQAVFWAKSLDSDLIACGIHELGDSSPDSFCKPFLSASFEGCGCIIRRSSFLSVKGYLPLRFAYGMEESDLALQLLDKGFRIHRVSSLRVFHNCDRKSHHSSPSVNSAQISNALLLGFLRYPLVLWPLSLVQCLNRVLYALRVRRFRGILNGVISAPWFCWIYRKNRAPVSLRTVLYSRRLSKFHSQL
jgi:GT2 family glycosyltransferase